MRTHLTPEQRFWKHVTAGPFTECWIWQGARNAKGYGRFGFRGRNALAHRVSYELYFGSIPDGIQICHHCDNPPCVNPYHLFAGTHDDNMKDRDTKGRVNSKVTREDVVRIRHLRSLGTSKREIAKEFGITVSAVYLIATRRVHKDVP